MSFRFYNPAPVFHDLLGLDPCNGGSLTFCELGTTTLKGTWSDREQTIPNENPVPLDSAGRSNTNIWLDGAYTVFLRDANGVQVDSSDVDSGQGAGAALPPMEPGKFLTTDGSNWLMADVRQVPDPSGSPDTILGTDGTILIWTAKPEPPPAAEVSGVDKVIIKTGGDTDWMILKGQGTSPASGTQKSSLPVTFATAFKAGTTPNVTLIPSPGLQASGAVVVPYLSSVPTATGFTAAFDVAEGNPSEANVNTPIVFQWIAQGQVPAA